MQANLINVPATYHQLINKTVQTFLRKYQLNSDIAVDISFVSKRQIRALNKKYRHIDKSTDVLSFPIWDNLKGMPKLGRVALGDIFICPEETEIDQNLSELIIHSLNHLVGKHH